ncbi:hypothetical protein B0G69_2927 [Paraburkholderia sp. RAU2J]|nr:hypothetical protein B0G69_2927 [Paraburkholderia sp. RAU2J]
MWSIFVELAGFVNPRSGCCALWTTLYETPNDVPHLAQMRMDDSLLMQLRQVR